MADKWAVATGDWSDTSTWNDSTLPGSTDDVYANGFTVTIDQDITVNSLRTTLRSGGTINGQFLIEDGWTINNSLWHATNSAPMAIYNGSGNIYINGEVSQLSSNGNTGNPILDVTGSGNVYIVGEVKVTGGNQSTKFAVRMTNTSNVHITGNVSGVGISPAINLAGLGLLTIIGSIASTGSGAQPVINVTGGGTIDVTGNITAGSSVGINSGAVSTVFVNGNVYASNNANAITYSNLNSYVIVNGNIIASANGMCGVWARNLLFHPTDEITHTISTYTPGLGVGEQKTLFTSNALDDFPLESDVRADVSYADNTLTGTLEIPPPESVAYGVPTDNTTGTAILTASLIREALGLSEANLDTKINNIPAQVLSKSSTDVEDTAATDSLCGILRRMDKSNITDNPGNLTIYKSDGEVFDTLPIQTAETLPIVGIGGEE